MQPDHRQSNYWVPPQDNPIYEPIIPAVVEPAQPIQPIQSPEISQPFQPTEITQPIQSVQPSVTEPASEPEIQTQNEATIETPAEYDESSQDEDIVRWQALEHIPHERNLVWFVVFALVALVLLAVAVFLARSWSFAAVIIVAAVSLIAYVKRPPRSVSYTLSQKGLYVGDKLYNLQNYKSFGVIRNGIHYSVMLIPIKRFMPGLTVFFPHETGEQIVDHLAARLPMQNLKLDLLDKLVYKLRL